MSDEESTTATGNNEWLRGAFMLLFLLICELGKLVLGLTSLVQFIFVIVTGAANENLQRFGKSLGLYIEQVIRFLTYNSDEKPFPFSAWPDAGELDEAVRLRQGQQDEQDTDNTGE